MTELNFRISGSTATVSDNMDNITETETTIDEPPLIGSQTTTHDIDAIDVSLALSYLAKISPKRVSNHDDWIFIGTTLKSLGSAGLPLWDDWSKKSPKYRTGECGAQWKTLIPDPEHNIEELKRLADIDSPYEINTAPKGAIPEDYTIALREMGFEFRLNTCNDQVIVNGTPMNDIICAEIMYTLKNHGYGSKANAEWAWKHLSNQNKFHPVIDYLESLKWNEEDHIGKLCSYFKDINNVFHLWIKRWLIGCVAKVLAKPQGQQNRMLVLDGKQDIGKSYFVRWLCSPLPAFGIESPINPDDKDSSIRLMSKWIWEVSELGATTRKADREALKHFLSMEKVTVRKPYGHYDTEKPALANFIGTVNNDTGFLSDPTGSRRFMSCTLEEIDWNYAKDVDINQIWAQAVALLKQGEPWHLTKEENKQSNEINKNYEVENPFEQYIHKYFDIDISHPEWVMQTIDIVDILKKEDISGISLNQFQREISSVLKKMGLEKRQKRLDGYQNPKRVWEGIRAKINGEG